ncbi:ArsR family transcriptional regulator [Arthrobacter sp. NQ7]|uniref:ArsR family transcriptional regulator n=1 Tax=Arthrobacter sp. NQ7 TaxID=3032303 RepID=UPI0024109D3E|nr:ArsR family transcriptional regulator [Arthrobacter sp. NQ7]MDJ0458608.1 ArsR family transcriptional regulator [Arthrobacter sp. NQ7]
MGADESESNMKIALLRGKMGTVPKYALPEENWSEDLLLAQRVISTPSRLAIVGYLYANGPTLRATLIKELSLDTSLVGRNLDQLEDLGILIGDPPRGERVGRSTRWEVNKERYNRMAKALYDFLGIDLLQPGQEPLEG